MQFSSKTQTVVRYAAYALGLLSVAAGVPKVLQMPQEVAFLSALGLKLPMVTILGTLQCAGGALLFWKRHLILGAVLAGLAFLVSGIALMAGGNVLFGLVSLLLIAVLASVVYIQQRKNSANTA